MPLAQALLRADSVTPARGAVFDVLEDALAAAGFTVTRFLDGEAPDGPVENLLAVRGTGGPHLAFAGHVDVVPAGSGWTHGAFSGTIEDGALVGRGAVDMKGAVAAFAAAAAATGDLPGTTSLIITGDEEGPAVHGTRALMRHMADAGVRPDLCLVGEPTCVSRLGDTIKIGRRGSVNIWIDVPGREGHVAYPHLADNPVPRLVRLLGAIDAVVLDAGTAWFDPSNIEVTTVDVGNPATNVIPSAASARLSIRFNDLHRGDALVERIRALAAEHAPGATVRGVVSGEAFLTEPGALSAIVSDAILAETGSEPALSTSGGTSDARFLRALCPVIEFGLLNATMHKRDEAVPVEQLRSLTRIYEGVIRRVAGIAQLQS
nr:succinyl-diaminopimelate desuccinylase [Sphingomonas jejuensis]